MSKADRRRLRQNRAPMTAAEKTEWRDNLRELRKEQRIVKSYGKKRKWSAYQATKRLRDGPDEDDANAFFQASKARPIDAEAPTAKKHRSEAAPIKKPMPKAPPVVDPQQKVTDKKEAAAAKGTVKRRVATKTAREEW